MIQVLCYYAEGDGFVRYRKDGLQSKWRFDLYFTNVETFKKCIEKIQRAKGLQNITFPFHIDPEIMDVIENAELPNVSIIPGTPKDFIWSSSSLEEYIEYNIPWGWFEFFSKQFKKVSMGGDPHPSKFLRPSRPGTEVSKLLKSTSTLKKISDYLEIDAATYKIFPPLKKVFSAMICLPDDMRVVIIGQDPYHGEGQAMGICFSIEKGITPPPSLVNIYKELTSDGFKVRDPKSGDLSSWVKQGVFMPNTAFTVREGTAASHATIWKQFTEELIEYITTRNPRLVAILWGNHAQSYSSYFSSKLIVKSVHPSPLSASRGFFGSKPFSKVNTILGSIGKESIDWDL